MTIEALDPVGKKKISIALVGDCTRTVVVHTAIPEALGLTGVRLNLNGQWTWLATSSLESGSARETRNMPSRTLMPGYR